MNTKLLTAEDTQELAAVPAIDIAPRKTKVKIYDPDGTWTFYAFQVVYSEDFEGDTYVGGYELTECGRWFVWKTYRLSTLNRLTNRLGSPLKRDWRFSGVTDQDLLSGAAK